MPVASVEVVPVVVALIAPVAESFSGFSIQIDL
jgi:hypothetical protein